MRAHAILISIAVVGVLLAGCGPVTATTDAGPTSNANPWLHNTSPQQLTARSAAGVVRSIAARWAAPDAPAPTLNTPIEFRTIDYTATVFNPGASDGFTTFITTRRTTLVTPASAATIDATTGAPPRFATPADRALWQAAGRPSLGQSPASGQMQAIPPGNYSFLPQGTTLTYRQATTLPDEPHRLTAVILDHLRPYAGPHPAASLELRQLAFLIATAALTDAARSAAWQALASLPGLHTCQTYSGTDQPDTIDLCLGSVNDETVVNVNPGTGAILTIADRLLRPSPMYPHVPVNTIVESTTFLAA